MNNNTNNFKETILKYEETVFNDYISKRTDLIENIKSLQLNDLSQTQLINITSDIKLIIDPIKSSITNIGDYFTNFNNSFNNNDSVNTLNDFSVFMKNYILIDLFRKRSEDSDSLELSSDSLELSSESLEEV